MPLLVRPLAERAECFIEKARAKYGDRFRYDEVAYLKGTLPVQMTCGKHGPFTATPKTHLHSKTGGCPGCLHDLKSHNARLANPCRTTEEFIALAREVHGSKYGYESVVYENDRTKVEVICPQHGPFRMRPNKHLQGRGCRRCTFEKLRRERKLSVWTVVSRCLNAHEFSRYDRYDLRSYVNQYSKIRIHCPLHGWFRQTAVSHWNGHGCAKCSDSKGERRIRKALKQLGVKFTEQARFRGCRDKRPLPFDFYLPQHRVLIEYDGLQHFERSELWGGHHELELTRKRDAIRDRFAAEQGFRLIRIPYWDFDRIEAILRDALLADHASVV